MLNKQRAMAVVTSFQTRILIVEDDPVLAELLKETFQDSGFAVSIARNGDELRNRLASETIGLITLDLGLPGEDGLELAREIRAGNDVPIIIISGKSKKISRIVGLEVGADDYVVKPFDQDEIVARVRAVLRRTRRAAAPAHLPESNHGAPGNVVEFERWRFDYAGHRLWSPSGDVVDLTAGEIELLAVFVRFPRTPLTRADIASHLRGDSDSASERSIDVIVGRLRRKLEKCDDRVELIKTLRGAGYLFCPEVQQPLRSGKP
jgi:DNA-binding response OmpR family regulator